MCREFRRPFKKPNRYKREVLRGGKESCFFSGGKQNSPHVSPFFSAEDPFPISLPPFFIFVKCFFSAEEGGMERREGGREREHKKALLPVPSFPTWQGRKIEIQILSPSPSAPHNSVSHTTSIPPPPRFGSPSPFPGFPPSKCALLGFRVKKGGKMAKDGPERRGKRWMGRSFFSPSFLLLHREKNGSTRPSHIL